jgi:hypothetical protein
LGGISPFFRDKSGTVRICGKFLGMYLPILGLVYNYTNRRGDFSGYRWGDSSFPPEENMDGDLTFLIIDVLII